MKQKNKTFKFYVPFWVTIKISASIFGSLVKKSSSFLKLQNQMNNFWLVVKKIERYKESDHRLKDYLISIELEKVKLAEEKIAKLSNPDFQPNYEYTDAEIRSAYYDVGRSKACRVTERIQQHYEWSCSTETWTKNKEGANFKNHCACVGKTAGELWLDMNTDRWKSDVAIALGVEAGLRCDQ